MLRSLAAVLLLPTWLVPALAGQDNTNTAPARSVCINGAPLPGCRSFWITEAGYIARITPKSDPYSTDFDGKSASLDVGWMRNLSPTASVGVTLSAQLIQGVAFAIRPRFRYWLSPTSSLDLAPGLVVAGIPGSPRLAVDATYLWRDRVGVTVQSFVLPSTTYSSNGSFVTTRNRLVTYAGLRLGSKWGRLGALADAVAVATAFSIYAIVCQDRGCD